jgi:hypothetical protein
MMKRTFVSSVSLLLLLFSSSFAEIKGNGVEVRASSQKLEETKPGGIVTTSFLVSNYTGSEEEFLEELMLPAGWQKIVSQDFPLKLKPQEQQISVVAFLVPLTSPAGRYQISYSLKSQRDYSIADGDTISVVVLPVEKLELLVEDRPEKVLAGEVYQIGLRVVNRGNCQIGLRLQIKSTPEYPIKIDPSEIALEAGNSQVIKLKVDTDKKIKQRTRQIIEIEAKPEESRKDFASAKQTISVEVIPEVTEKPDLYHKLPSQVALVYAGGEKRREFQVEFSGLGSLDKEGKHKIDFLFRGPDIHEKSRWGKRDELTVSFLSRHLDLHFGDRSYLLSPLTERQSYGRGVEADIRPGKFGLGAFFLENRWGKPKTSKVGAYLSYDFNAKFHLRGNFLIKGMKRPFSFRDYDGRIYSLQTGFKPVKETRLNLEYGFSQSEKEGESNDFAFRVDLAGHIFNQISYSLERTFAGSKYLGYVNDADYKSGTLSFPLYRKLRGELFYRTYENNLDVDSTKGTANREKTYQSSISYSFASGTQISLDYKNLFREDRVLPADYNYEETTVKLRITEIVSKFSLSTDVERGGFEDKIKAIKSDNLERYSFYANFNASYWHSYSFYARIGHSSFTGSPERTKSLGISSFWHIKKKISLSLNYRWDESALNRSQRQNNLFSTLSYSLPHSHALVFRSQWSVSKQGSEKDFSFLAMYNIPLEIPLTEKNSTGVLKGGVYDKEGSSKKPVPKVILTAQGATAITDNNGEFIFPSLEPGTCFLQLERSSIGLDRVPTEKFPLLIEVRHRKAAEIEIGVVRSCRISGRVKVLPSAPDKKQSGEQMRSGDSLLWIGPGEKGSLLKILGNTLVELTDGKENLRQLTDQNGGFSFEDLRPGKWILKVHDEDLSSQYYLEQKEFQIELKPGEKKEVVVRVLPRLRPIQIIEEGEIRNK